MSVFILFFIKLEELMNKKNLIFLLIAVTGVIFFGLIGVSVAERSLLGVVLSLFASIMVIGVGFMLKKKWRGRTK
jgi:drug/metabolite transporter (DMT)-like permease